MQKVLVTGSSGFVGQHLIKTLKDTHLIIGLVHSSSLPSNEQVIYEQCDITHKTKLQSIIKKYLPDKIIHLAAQSRTWSKDLQELYAVNFFGTLNLYQSIIAIREEKRSYDPKILYISSSEVYGNAANPEAISEQNLLNPLSYYATSKVATDRLSFQVSQSDQLSVVIARPFAHIGPLQQTGFFVPDMISQIIEIENDPQKNTIYVGNLDSVREYLDVRDVVKAYTLLLEKDLPKGEVYNICRGQGTKTGDVLTMLLNYSQKQINIEKDPSRMRPSDIPISIGDHSKITKATGWEPEISLEQSLKDTFDYWRDNNKKKGN